jgi:hypothetical protein
MENYILCKTHGMLMLLLTTDPDLFGLDVPGHALDGGGWCCFFTFLTPLEWQWRGINLL